MARDLAFLRQSVELLDRPGSLVGNQAGQFEAIIGGRELRRIASREEGVVTEIANDIALRVGRRQPLIAKQKRLRAVIPPRHRLQDILDAAVIGYVATGQQRQRSEAQCLAQKHSPLDRVHDRFALEDQTAHRYSPSRGCGASEARPTTIATSVFGTSAVSARWTTRNPTIAAMPKKCTTRANS